MTRQAHIDQGCQVCAKPSTCYFRGVDIESLTRDELLVAYRHACDALDNAREAIIQEQEMGLLFDSTRKALQR